MNLASEQERIIVLSHIGGSDAKAIIIVDKNEAGELLSSVVVDSFTGSSCSAHIWIRVLRLQFFCDVLRYIFVELDCARFTGIVFDNNLQAVNFNTKLGGTIEGRILQGHPEGDTLLFAHWKHNLERFWSRNHG